MLIKSAFSSKGRSSQIFFAPPTSASLHHNLQVLQRSCVPGPGPTTHPKLICDPPPGGFATRVVLRSVMKLPQFWFAPEAYAFEELPDALDPKTMPLSCRGGAP
mmetsp:Transcript_17618/g.48364  ORF Transcript_17618/g.48364 Transcript_17618/m.48364 type:complete len:104 (-) Transcript_17618:1106-1417(-)